MYFLSNEACPAELAKLFEFVNSLLNLIKIAIPILLLIVGSIDLGKAVVAGEEKEIKAAQGMLVKRTMAAVAVFFVGTIVALAMSLVNEDWEDCLNPRSASYNNENIIIVQK